MKGMMGKMKKSLLILIILIAMIITCCNLLHQAQVQIESVPKEKAEEQHTSEDLGLSNHGEPINKYIITVDYDKKENTLKVMKKLIIHNNGNKIVDNIILYYIQLYKNLETVPAIGSAEKAIRRHSIRIYKIEQY